MSDDFRRRRRLNTPGSPRRSGGNNGMNPWVVTIFAAIVVIAGGWFLGQALARVFNGPPNTEKVAQAPTALPIVTPPASPSAAPTIEPTATPTEKPAPTSEPTPTATPQTTPQPSPTATVNVVVTPSKTAAPTPSATPALEPTRTPQPTAAPTQKPNEAPAPEAESPATRVVRAYIDALRRGDPAAASTYLGNGVPDESFIDSATRINSVSSTKNSDGSYKVAVDMHTGRGEYYETFTVASDRILEKTAIKP